MKNCICFFSALMLLISCQKKESKELKINRYQATSFLNDSLFSKQIDAQKDSLRIKNYNKALKNYKENDDWENIIWAGRRIAYLGDFNQAIDYFTIGHEKYPEKAEFLRHRGHRYITVRKIEEAIKDLKKASEMIDGKEDIIEEDGIPNALNIPISSLNTNIYYHLGLAYYINGDYEKALKFYQKNFEVSNNDDNLVSTSHWLYMILRRMNLMDEANKVLEPITENMNIIENKSYYNLLLFYKGLKTEEELLKKKNGASGASEAVLYGIGNWYFYNGNKQKGIDYFKEMLANGNWGGFGYICAEADLSRLKV